MGEAVICACISILFEVSAAIFLFPDAAGRLFVGVCISSNIFWIQVLSAFRTQAVGKLEVNIAQKVLLDLLPAVIIIAYSLAVHTYGGNFA
jgi:hypothetical protein